MSDWWNELGREDAAADAAYERHRRAQLHHWCDECHGHTGPGSPCAPDVDDEQETEE